MLDSSEIPLKIWRRGNSRRISSRVRAQSSSILSRSGAWIGCSGNLLAEGVDCGSSVASSGVLLAGVEALALELVVNTINI